MRYEKGDFDERYRSLMLMDIPKSQRFDGANMTASEQKFELYYGGDDNLVHELQYNFGSLTWSTQATFVNTNGNAGIECSASDPNLSYVFLSNIENKLELWWKDDNKNATNSTKRPVGVWRKGRIPINQLLWIVFTAIADLNHLSTLSRSSDHSPQFLN